jgi:hypothetical protein
MRRTLVALSTAAARITGALVFGSKRAEAMVGAPPLGHAAQSINPIEKTACWRLGWHGWGLYPCGYYYGGYRAVTLTTGMAILIMGMGMAGVPTGAGAGGVIAGGAGAMGAGAATITIVNPARTRRASRPQWGGTFGA